MRRAILCSASNRALAAGGAAAFVNTKSLTVENGNGGTRQRIEGPTDTTIFTSAPIGSFSVAMWVKVDQTLAQWEGPCGSPPNSSFQAGWGVYRNSNDSQVYFYVGAFNASFHQATVTNFWQAGGGWKHLVCVFDAPNRQFTIYTDNTKSQSAVDTAATTRNLGIEHLWGAHEENTYTFNGSVNVPAFWQGTILSDAQVSSLYNSGVPVDPSTVVAPTYWLATGDDPADDITPTTGVVNDQTANGHDFTPLALDNDPAMAFEADVP